MFPSSRSGSMLSRTLRLALLTFLFICSCSGRTQLVNLNVERTVTLNRQSPLVNVVCTVKNFGDSPADHYLLYISREDHQHISYILGGEGNEAADMRHLQITDTDETNAQHVYTLLTFGQPLGPGEDTVVQFTYVLFDSLEPYPRMVKQSEEQYMMFKFSALFYSPYETSTQATVLKTERDHVLAYCEDVSPVAKLSDSVKYGPFTVQKPLVQHACFVHYRNNRKLLTVQRLDRLVRVSHWSSISVEDRVHVVHKGAQLEQGFSRLEYMQFSPRPTAVPSFTTTIPKLSQHIYYRDDIGNISTSRISSSTKSLALELTPRFPLFGGWQTVYMTGYHLPSSAYIKHRGDRYTANVRFIDHIMNDMEVAHMRLSVALPEKAHSISIESPFPIQYTCNSSTFWYLDTVGRPTCVIEYRRLSNWHSKNIKVSYELSPIDLYRKPVYLSLVALVAFVLAILTVRVDFSLVQDPKFEQEMRRQADWEQVKNAVLELDQTYGRIRKAIHAFKKDREFCDLENAFKRCEIEFKANSAKVSAAASTDNVCSHKLYTSKLTDMNSANTKVRERFRACVQLAQKFTTSAAKPTNHRNVLTNAEDECLQMVDSLSTKLNVDWRI